MSANLLRGVTAIDTIFSAVFAIPFSITRNDIIEPTTIRAPISKSNDLNDLRSLSYMLFTASDILPYMPRATPFIVSKTDPDPSEIPLLRPDIIYLPNSVKSFDGDAIPRRSQNAVIIDLARFIIALTALEIPE